MRTAGRRLCNSCLVAVCFALQFFALQCFPHCIFCVAAVLRCNLFFSRCSFFVLHAFALQFLLRWSFFCTAVLFVLQFFCDAFFSVAVFLFAMLCVLHCCVFALYLLFVLQFFSRCCFFVPQFSALQFLLRCSVFCIAGFLALQK